MKQKKAYKYRIYPTQEQAHILARTFGCCRYVYNWALRARTDAFFQRGEYPTFHKKHGVQAATYAANAFTWDGKRLTLARMETPLDIHWSRPLPKGCQPSSVTITKDCANRYFVSILVEEDIKHLPGVNKQVGLDLGLKSMVITSDGEHVGNPRYFRKDEKKLAQAQRRLSKKKKGSKNRAKARLKVAKVHAKIADRRR